MHRKSDMQIKSEKKLHDINVALSSGRSNILEAVASLPEATVSLSSPQTQTQRQQSPVASFDTLETPVSNRQVPLLPPLQQPINSAQQDSSPSPKKFLQDHSSKSSLMALSHRSEDNGEKYHILVVDDSPLNRKVGCGCCCCCCC